MAKYIIADINLNDIDAAQRENLDMNKYNEMIIDNWNNTVQSNDSVLVAGCFAKKGISSLSELNHKLNGRISIISLSENPDYTEEDFKNSDFGLVIDGHCFVDSDCKIVYFPERENIVKSLDFYEYRLCTAAAHLNSVIESRQFSIEAKYWGFCPIEIKEIPQLIEKLKDFMEMEDGTNVKE